MNHTVYNKKPSFFIGHIVWLLTAVRKVRVAGLIVLLLAFLINFYFILFDQQSYIAFLEHYSPDGNIKDIHFIFLKVQILIISVFLLWLLITNQSSISYLLEQPSTLPQPKLHWRQRGTPYFIAYGIWLLISYIPVLFFDYETIRTLAKEDSFYEYSGFLWLFLTSISFFYLFFRGFRSQSTPSQQTRPNVFSLILGLLFFFGAGEEISWGQRLFKFKTPDIAASNFQNSFNLHNMPFFDIRASVIKTKDGRRISLHKTGISHALTMQSLFGYFWFSFCVIIPILYISSIKIHKWLDVIHFPAVPIWIGFLFILNYFIIYEMSQYFISHGTMNTIDEIGETTYSLLFFILALWFINNRWHRRKQSSA